MKIEILFPELCTLYGDAGNILYIKSSLKDAEITETHYQDKPLFAKERVDMIYIGSMSENNQLFAIKYLMPYKERLRELIEDGVVFLATGNAMELFGEYIADDENKWEALGLFPFYSKRKTHYFRHNSHYLGSFNDIEVVGYKSQFSFCYGDFKDPFMKVLGGCGNTPDDLNEGIHYKNFFATYVIGPLLPFNPYLAKHIFSLAGFEGEVAFEKEAIEAYECRLRHLKQEDVNFFPPH